MIYNTSGTCCILSNYTRRHATVVTIASARLAQISYLCNNKLDCPQNFEKGRGKIVNYFDFI